jgi:hypothetical protein
MSWEIVVFLWATIGQGAHLCPSSLRCGMGGGLHSGANDLIMGLGYKEIYSTKNNKTEPKELYEYE